eukprot:CAMPEP_0172833186 /NCGR_PEP_ID=MMETSP1075-20121228/24194_1 /TAXON_ID=2916 /ORGANISM="Ceratium fusus, Strain PA161109" /LENGTH=644 /DNA_ID=CAMNT_0013675903 /DNA_START=53 /DNA_END=1983 /DNA_ORIENTATION=+
MELEVVSVSGVSGDVIVSAQTGDVTAPCCQQAKVSELLNGTSLCPEPLAAGESPGPLQLELLQPLGAARVVLRPRAEAQTYRVPLDGSGAAYITFCIRGAGCCETSNACSIGDNEKLQDSVSPLDATAKAYAEKHCLMPLMRSLLRTLVRDHPEEPFSFLGEQFVAALPEQPDCDRIRSLALRHQGLGVEHRNDAFAEVRLLATDGIPSDAILSVRAWNSRQQASVAVLNSGKVFRFKVGPAGLNPFKLEVLRPLGQANFSLDACRAGEHDVDVQGTSNASIRLLMRAAGSGSSRQTMGRSKQAWPSCIPASDSPVFPESVVFASDYLEARGILCDMKSLLRKLLQERPCDPLASIARWYRERAASASTCNNLSKGSDRIPALIHRHPSQVLLQNTLESAVNFELEDSPPAACDVAVSSWPPVSAQDASEANIVCSQQGTPIDDYESAVDPEPKETALDTSEAADAFERQDAPQAASNTAVATSGPQDAPQDASEAGVVCSQQDTPINDHEVAVHPEPPETTLKTPEAADASERQDAAQAAFEAGVVSSRQDTPIDDYEVAANSEPQETALALDASEAADALERQDAPQAASNTAVVTSGPQDASHDASQDTPIDDDEFAVDLQPQETALDASEAADAFERQDA